MSLYLYAFGRLTEAPELKGLDKAAVRLISNGSVAALASRFEGSRVRPRRRHLLAHDQTIRKLMEHHSLLPVSFGTLAESKASLLDLLNEHSEVIETTLGKVQDRVEMVARSKILADNLFERCVQAYPRLKEARDRMVTDDASQDRNRMIAVGQLFDTLRQEERDRVREIFLSGLDGTFDDMQLTEPKAEEQLFDLSFLVPKAGVEAWEKAVEDVAAKLDDDLSIDLAGPLPPYSFSHLQLSFPGAEI